VGNSITQIGITVPENEIMPNTDIDGSVVVILSEAEARRVYHRLEDASPLDNVEQGIIRKIERDLKL